MSALSGTGSLRIFDSLAEYGSLKISGLAPHLWFSQDHLDSLAQHGSLHLSDPLTSHGSLKVCGSLGILGSLTYLESIVNVFNHRSQYKETFEILPVIFIGQFIQKSDALFHR